LQEGDTPRAALDADRPGRFCGSKAAQPGNSRWRGTMVEELGQKFLVWRELKRDELRDPLASGDGSGVTGPRQSESQ